MTQKKLIIKKKNGKDEEIQDGLQTGHVIPFELVGETLRSDDYAALAADENRLSEIPSEYEDLLESLTEEEKESDILTESGDSFVAKEVTKKLRALKNEEITSRNS